MKQTRKFEIKDRVVELTDLMRIAAILEKQIIASKSEESWPHKLTCRVEFADDMTIEGAWSEIFCEEELNRPASPVSVTMSFRSASSSRDVSVRLSSGENSYGNAVIISAEDDPDWLNANYTALRDSVDKIKPQSFWFRRHRILLLGLIAFGIGYLQIFPLLVVERMMLGRSLTLPARDTFSGAILHVLASSPILLNLVSSPLLNLIMRWIYPWLFGLVWAIPIRSWLLAKWPNVEFHFGSPHLRIENRRKWLIGVVTLLGLPILASGVYDLLKLAFP